MEKLDAMVDDLMTLVYGHVPVTRTEIIGGDDVTSLQRADLGRQIAELTEEHFVRQVIRPDFHQQMAALQAAYDALPESAAEPARIVEMPTGETVAELFAHLDRNGKRQFMLDKGWSFAFARDEHGEVRAEVISGTTGEQESLLE